MNSNQGVDFSEKTGPQRPVENISSSDSTCLKHYWGHGAVVRQAKGMNSACVVGAMVQMHSFPRPCSSLLAGQFSRLMLWTRIELSKVRHPRG